MGREVALAHEQMGQVENLPVVMDGRGVGVCGAESGRQGEGKGFHANGPGASRLVFSMRSKVAVTKDPLQTKRPGLARRVYGGLVQGGAAITATALITLAVIIGMQLGGAPWRYRKQIWQLQGAMLGAVVGFVVGRLSASSPKDPEA